MEKGVILKGINHLPDEIHEIRLRNKKNILGALLVGFAIAILAMLILTTYDLNYPQRTIVALTLLVLYGIILFFLLEPRIVHHVKHREIHHYERPVIREVVRRVEKPSVKEMEKPTIISSESGTKKMLVKPLPFVGSSETKIYHLHNCRFAGMIKKEYKEEHDDLLYFRARGFAPCKVCILKERSS